MSDNNESKLVSFIKQIPAKRYFLAAKRMDVSQDELTSDSITLAIFIANELKGQDSGNYDNFAELLNWGLGDLNELVNNSLGDDDDDSKSESNGSVLDTEG